MLFRSQEVYAEEGSKFPDVEFDFIYDMASFLNYYAYAFSLAGLARITGVNQGQLSHYVTGRRRPSKSTVEKIEPVSYTHLDVYKRQGLLFVAFPYPVFPCRAGGCCFLDVYKRQPIVVSDSRHRTSLSNGRISRNSSHAVR